MRWGMAFDFLVRARRLAMLAAAGLTLSSGVVHAAPEEVQVYMDELNAKGQFGLDLHINDALHGDGAPDYPGGEASLHRWRLTPEFSLGLGHGLELGAYLPLATLSPGGSARADGVKARLKWLAPHQDTGFYAGLNYEIGYSSHRLDQNPWNNEVKLIGGWRDERWQLGVNGNVDFALSGPNPGPATLEIATKAAYKVTKSTAIGIESYNGLGPLHAIGQLADAEHSSYLVVDTSLGKWDLNAGIGKGYGANKDSLVVKFILSVPIDSR